MLTCNADQTKTISLKSQVSGAKMTTALDNRRHVETKRPPSGHANKTRDWLTDQWPKAGLALGLGVTIAWMAVLVWLLNRALNIF
jgi:hypothetical protein